MRYRVIEDLGAVPEARYVLEASPFGHVWTERERFPDELSAEIAMEKLAAPPRLIAEARGQ